MYKKSRSLISQIVWHASLLLTALTSYAEESSSDDWSRIKEDGTIVQLRHFIRENPESDELNDAATRLVQKLTEQQDLLGLVEFQREFTDFELPVKRAKNEYQSLVRKHSGLDTRFAFREGKIGERYVPVLSHSYSSTNTRYINGHAVNETTYHDSTSGGYDQNRYGFTVVYQLFNESAKNYIIRLRVSGSSSMTELKVVGGGAWEGEERHKEQKKTVQLAQETSYLVRAGETIKDQLIAGETKPEDFKMDILEVVPVSNEWIEKLQELLEPEKDEQEQEDPVPEGFWNQVVYYSHTFWQSVSGLFDDLIEQAAPEDRLKLIESYLLDARADKWHEVLKQRYTEAAVRRIEIELQPEARYDRDFDSEVVAYLTNKSGYDLVIDYQPNFGASGQVIIVNGKRNRLVLRGKGKSRDNLRLTINQAVNRNPLVVKQNTNARSGPSQAEIDLRIADRNAAREEKSYFNKATNFEGIKAYLEKLPNGKRRAEVEAKIEPVLFADATTVSGTDFYRKMVPTDKQRSEFESHAQTVWKKHGFRDNGDGTVTDLRSNLMWMRCSPEQSWNGTSCSGKAKSFSWDTAMQAAKTFVFAGKKDWRLPTKKELSSIVVCSSGKREGFDKKGAGGWCQGHYNKPTIDTAVFPDTPSSQFWTSSPLANNKGSAWGISFSAGGDDGSGYYKSRNLYVRLVRSHRE